MIGIDKNKSQGGMYILLLPRIRIVILFVISKVYLKIFPTRCILWENEFLDIFEMILAMISFFLTYFLFGNLH